MDDSKIVALYFERSEYAVNETEKAYGKLCYSVAYGILSSREDAEECVNDTYLRAWNSIPPQKPKKFSAYLARIARNLALDRLFKKNAQKSGGTLITEELTDAIPTSSGDPSDELALKAALDSFFRTLAVRDRKLFLGRYFYCMSIAELMKTYGEKESNVKVILMRTRQALKAHLEAEGIAL